MFLRIYQYAALRTTTNVLDYVSQSASRSTERGVADDIQAESPSR